MSKKLMINGEAVAASQEGTLVVELFLNENYRFRRNLLNGKVEFMTLPESEGANWRPLTQEALNSILLKAEREHIVEKGSPSAHIKMYVQSEEVPEFNPVLEFLNNLPQWDGKNHVAEVFSRLPGISTEQHHFLAIWIRSMVAHWLQMDMLHGNECVPTLIGDQGCGKTTFVRRLLPPLLRQYYLDHLNLSNKFDKEMALTNNLLVNLDELDAIRPSQHAALKQNFMEEKDIAEILNVCVRKPEEGEVAQAMDCKQLLELVQKEYPLVQNTRSTKIHIGLAMKESGYESTKRGNRAFYKVIPIVKAA